MSRSLHSAIVYLGCSNRWSRKESDIDPWNLQLVRSLQKFPQVQIALELRHDEISLHHLSASAMLRYQVTNQYFLVVAKVDLEPQVVHESLRMKHDVEHEI